MLLKKAINKIPLDILRSNISKIIFLLVIFALGDLFFFKSPVVYADTLGYTAIGSSTESDPNVALCQGEAGINGTITSLSVYFTNIDSGPNNQFSTAIYTDSGLGTTPSSTVATSSASQTLTSGWNTANSFNYHMNSGSIYWICFNQNASANTFNLAHFDTGIGTLTGSSATFGTWPTGSWSGDETNNFSIYATYTPDATPSATPTFFPTPTGETMIDVASNSAFAVGLTSWFEVSYAFYTLLLIMLALILGVLIWRL